MHMDLSTGNLLLGGVIALQGWILTELISLKVRVAVLAEHYQQQQAKKEAHEQ